MLVALKKLMSMRVFKNAITMFFKIITRLEVGGVPADLPSCVLGV